MNIETLRTEIEALDVEIRGLHQTEEGELREFTPEEQTTFDEKVAERAQKMALLERHEAIQAAAKIPERTIAPKAPAVVINTRDAMEVVEDRSSTRKQISDAAMRSLEDKDIEPENLAHVRSILNRHSGDREWARGIILRSTDEYASAWLKIIQGREHALTNEERTVLGVSTNANGKYLLPTHLDPTIILTSALSTNEVRKLARVVTLTDGQPAWNGVTSAGVTASWDGEVVEVSDDSPTFGNPSIATVRAQALVQASISAVEDIADLGSDVMMMFADAKDRLEGAAHAVGVGTTTPKGVFTAVNAASKTVTSGTAATIALADLHSVYTSVPKRYRASSTWLANPLYTTAIKALGTAISASYSGDLREHRRPDPRRSGGRVGRRSDHADHDRAGPGGPVRGLLPVRDRGPAGRHERGVHPAPVQHHHQPARRSSGLVRHLEERLGRHQRRRLPPAGRQDLCLRSPHRGAGTDLPPSPLHNSRKEQPCPVPPSPSSFAIPRRVA